WRQVVAEFALHCDARRAELMIEQCQRVEHDAIDVNIAKLGAAGAREVQQVADDLGSAERLARNLFQQPSLLRIGFQLFREHLRIRRNHRQRRVDFVRNAGGQQTNRGELVGLRELRLQFDTLGNVIHDDQPPDHVELARDQWRDGGIDGSNLACRRAELELVEVVNSRILAYAIELLDKLRRENLAQ